MGWLRDRRFRLALELSLVAHLLLLWLAPQGHQLVAAWLHAAVPPPPPPAETERPLRFELVELPDTREEPPRRPDAPASDRSRRAGGGEGEPDAERAGTRGSTWELRHSPGAPTQLPMPAAPQVPPAPSPVPQPPSERPSEADGAAAVLEPVPDTARQPSPPRPVLQGLSPLRAPSTLGAIAPDRRGGQVDLGPLSFDTQWYDWGPYAAEMLRRIRYHWRIPEIAMLGVQGVVRIHFKIERDGRVTGLEIQRESSHPPMDFAARDAILNASPLPPLPKDLTGVEREGVTITFFYNVRPPDDGR